MTVDLCLGDCLELMREIPDGSVDAVITDPPYGVGIDYGVYHDTADNWKAMFLQLIPEARRIATMVILPSCRMKMLPFIYQNVPPDWLICWHKGSPGTASFIGFNDWEPLLVYGKNKGVQMHDYFSIHNTEKMGSYGHPCPKPVGWAEWLVSRATKEGQTILDPFMGSGTTGVACVKLNRNFIGMEINPQYFEIAQRRIAEAQAQLALPTESLCQPA